MNLDSDQGTQAHANHQARRREPWHRRTLVIVLGLLSVGPLALPLVWLHPRCKWHWKILITLAVALLTWACIVLTRVMLEHLREQLDLILELSE